MSVRTSATFEQLGLAAAMREEPYFGFHNRKALSSMVHGNNLTGKDFNNNDMINPWATKAFVYDPNMQNELMKLANMNWLDARYKDYLCHIGALHYFDTMLLGIEQLPLGERYQAYIDAWPEISRRICYPNPDRHASRWPAGSRPRGGAFLGAGGGVGPPGGPAAAGGRPLVDFGDLAAFPALNGSASAPAALSRAGVDGASRRA